MMIAADRGPDSIRTDKRAEISDPDDRPACTNPQRLPSVRNDFNDRHTEACEGISAVRCA
jgi:hypothetical protein